jgi:replication-associated recombination protein RarA
MAEAAAPPDPWVLVRTVNGFNADEVISSLQKSIRRGLLENALLLAYEMAATSAELEEHLWARLSVISVEDVGGGSFLEPVIIDSLYRMHQRFPRGAGDRFLFATHAIRLLATAPKDRVTDEMANWAKLSVDIRGERPEIPDVAYDMHTRRGREMGRGLEHFMKEGAQVANERPGRDTTYRERLLAAIAAGELT